MVERVIREDCFANPRWGEKYGQKVIVCDALISHQNKGHGIIGNLLDCGSCPFYKSKEENDAVLMKRHGTTDMTVISERYSIALSVKNRRAERMKSLSCITESRKT